MGFTKPETQKLIATTERVSPKRWKTRTLATTTFCSLRVPKTNAPFQAFSPAKEMASLGLRLKSATWTLRSGAAAVSRRCSWELGKGFRGFCAEAENDVVPTSGISRPLAEILKELNKKVPDSVIKTRVEDGFAMKYIPWHIVNRIMNLHAPEWSGEVRSVTYSPDGNTVTVAYRVTLYGTDAEIFRESTGTTSVNEKGYGDAVQKAEAMAFRRACARLGLGLHLYHEDAL